MPYAKLFRSRWAALLWAAGMLWTAVEVAGVSPATPPDNATQATDTDATGMPVDSKDLAILASVMNGN